MQNTLIVKLALRKTALDIIASHAKAQEHSQGKDVASFVSLAIAKLLGRSVAACTKLSGIALGVWVEGTCNAKVNKRDGIVRGNYNVGGFEVSVDERRIEALMQLHDCFAEPRAYRQQELLRWAALCDTLFERLPGNMFRDYDATIVDYPTFQNAGKMQEPLAITLGVPNSLIGLTQATIELDALANEGATLRAIYPNKKDAFGPFLGALFEHSVHTIAVVVLKGIKISGELIFHSKAMVSAKSLLLEAVKLFVRLLEGIAMGNAEDNDGVATILAIQAIYACAAQEASRLEKG